MTHLIRRAAAVLVAVVALVGGSTALAGSASAATASPSASSHHVYLLNCEGERVVRPKDYILTCADANTFLAHTRWTSWGGSRAHARAVFAENICTPNCAEGHFAHYDVTVTARHLVSKDGVARYRQIVVAFPHRHPSWVKHGHTVFTVSYPRVS